MPLRRLALPCVLLLALVSARANAAKEARPIVSVQVRSINEVLADVKYLAALGGHEEEGKQLDAMIQSLGGENGLRGIDTKRPLGFYQGEVTSPAGVAMIPISSEKDFIDLLENVGNQKPKKGEGGLYSMSVEFPKVTVYFRFVHKYLYATAGDPSLVAADGLLTPERVFSAKRRGLVSAQIQLDEIPDGLKQIGLSQMEVQLANLKEQKQPNETEAETKFREQLLDDIGARIKRVVTQGESVELSLDINRQAGQLRAEASLTGKGGSKLAANIADLGKVPSLFAGLVTPDSAISGVLHAGLPENLRPAFEAALDQTMARELKKETDASKRATSQELVKVLTPSLKAGVVDAFFDFRGPSADEHYTVIGGLGLKDGRKVEQAFRRLIARQPAEERGKFHFDAEKAGDVSITRVDVQKDLKARDRKILGSNPVYMAFRQDALLITAGPDGLAALKQALPVEAKAAPMATFTMRLARMVPLVGLNNPNAASIGKQVFGQGGPANDRVRLQIRGGDALRLDVSMQAAAIKFLSQVVDQNRQKAPATTTEKSE